VAHEWGHSFFYARTARGIVRAVPDSPEQEAFCDEFARALLVPPAVAAAMRPCADSALELQDRFDCSLQVAVRAVADAHPGVPIWLLVVPEHETAFVQWRSPGSFGTSVSAAAIRDAVSGTYRRAPGLAVCRLHERRQALVFG
jgi:hypothetical protein